MTVFRDPEQERRMVGPWYENLESGGQLVAQVYDHSDGSTTMQIKDGRWVTFDGFPKICAAKHFPNREVIDLDTEVRALGYEPDSEAKTWKFAGHACWFDPEDWDGEPTESYAIKVNKMEDSDTGT
ncbi:hypothetical protein [Streptomyces tsukubensis]|uniref:hypothetical protein n=1 Tax=Streptomyces tsukubensis TaxID=83656 RepID=UPI00344EF639